MPKLLTQGGRIPKNKWVVVPHPGGRIISRHKLNYKARDKARAIARRTGKRMVVCEIYINEHTGRPELWADWLTPE